MPCSNPTYTGVRNDVFPWENFVRSIRYNVPSHFLPDTLENLVWILENAETENKQVKAVGSGWSIENIAVSEWVVDISSLSNTLTYLIDGGAISNAIVDAKRTAHTTTSNKFMHVEAGVKLFDLNVRLEGLGLSMVTLGGAQGQTLAGAISTSTHGSDIDHQPLPDLIEAIHLVTNGGREFWIESSSDPFTDDDTVLQSLLPCAETTIIRDDALFNAAKVSVGRFGVVYSYVLKITDTFRIAEWANSMSWAAVSSALRSGITAGSRFAPLNAILPAPPATLSISGGVGYRYLDFAFNPRNKSSCWVRRRWPTNGTTDMNLEASDNFLCHTGVGNVVAAVASAALATYSVSVSFIPIYGLIKAPQITAHATALSVLSLNPLLTGGEAMAAAANAIWDSQIGDELSGLIQEVNQIALDMSAGASNSSPKRGVFWKVNSGTTESAFDRDCFNGTSIEVIFDATSSVYIDFIDMILDESNRFLHIGYISVRYSQSSEALLSMHNFGGNMSVSIEVTSLHGLKDSNRWLDFLEQKALEMGGRLHWGQKNNLNAVDVIRHYGGLLNEWRGQLDRIVEGSPMFSNAYTSQRGLEPFGIERRVTGVRRMDGKITHLCGEGYWSPVSVETAMAEIDSRRTSYYVSSPATDKLYLTVRQYLATEADDTEANNLRSLPVQNLPFGRPAETHTDREVTFIQVYTVEGYGSDAPWNTWVTYLGNAAETWKVHSLEAQSQIESGSHRYFILNGDGTRNYLIFKRYLISPPNEHLSDNLDSLPNC